MALTAHGAQNRDDMHHNRQSDLKHRSPKGFTLVEVLIVMVVVAILAAVALPTFNESVRKSRRSEAMTALTTLQQAQERWRGNNAAYTDDLEDLGIPSETVSGYYTLAIAAPGDGVALTNGYIATAYGKSDTSQAADTQCRRLGVLMTGGVIKYAGCGSCSSFSASDFATTHACWTQ